MGELLEGSGMVKVVLCFVLLVGVVRANLFKERPKSTEANVPVALGPPSKHTTDSKCKVRMHVQWSMELEASIYATPVISDLDGDGSKELVVNTYNQFVHVIDAKSGYTKSGWPFSMESETFHSSPLVADVDGDGSLEVISVSYGGDVLVFGKDGLPYLSKTIQIPKLQVKRDWYKSNTKAAFDNGVPTTAFAAPSQQETAKVIDKLKAGIHSDHAHSSPILPFSDNENGAYVAMPFDEAGVESFKELFSTDISQGGAAQQSKQILVGEHVLVDSHVLSSAILADVDGDGVDDLIVPVSYFFDRETFDFSVLLEEIVDLDLSKYVAGGLVVFDLRTGQVKWSVQLELTTEREEYRGYMYSTPTAVDLDADGSMEVIVGTSVGNIYVLDSKGEIREGFPVQMSEIQGQIAVADVNADGKLDLIVCDSNSNIAVWDSDGQLIWERQLAGFSAHGATLGDVDGDGVLDIVVTTSLGFVFALNKTNGVTLPNFPVKFSQRIVAPALPIRNDGQLHHSLVVPCFDGHVYVIDGFSGCVDSVDIGEHSYSMVLADDLTGNGKMQFIVTSMNGMVYCLSSMIPFHPLKAWRSQNLLFNGFAPRDGHVGVLVDESTRQVRDVMGSKFVVGFWIVDRRPEIEQFGAYKVKISLGQRTLFYGNFSNSGFFLVHATAPSTRMAGVVRVVLEDQFSMKTSDSFSVSFHMHFWKMMKWIIILPFALLILALIFIKELKTPLPM